MSGENKKGFVPTRKTSSASDWIVERKGSGDLGTGVWWVYSIHTNEGAALRKAERVSKRDEWVFRVVEKRLVSVFDGRPK